jgi:hypothetical protein
VQCISFSVSLRERVLFGRIRVIEDRCNGNLFEIFPVWRQLGNKNNWGVRLLLRLGMEIDGRN